jgi:hypothetical protein
MQSLIQDFYSNFNRKISNCLLVECHPCPVCPPVLPLHLTTNLLIFLQLLSTNLPYRNSLNFMCKCHVNFLLFLEFQRIRPSPRLCVTFRNKRFLWREVVSYMTNNQSERPSFVGCPEMLIQYICCYPPYMEAVSSTFNLKGRHVLVITDPLYMEFKCRTQKENRQNTFQASTKVTK